MPALNKDVTWCFYIVTPRGKHRFIKVIGPVSLEDKLFVVNKRYFLRHGKIFAMPVKMLFCYTHHCVLWRWRCIPCSQNRTQAMHLPGAAYRSTYCKHFYDNNTTSWCEACHRRYNSRPLRLRTSTFVNTIFINQTNPQGSTQSPRQG